MWVTPAFPKLIYVLEEDNIHEDAPYWYLTELAAKCTAKRMVPDYISEKKMQRKVKNGEGTAIPAWAAARFLTPLLWTATRKTGKHKYYGRFNQGVVTINLPDVALSSGGNIEKFWKIFDERLELCHRALHVPPRAPEGHRCPTPRPSCGSTALCARLKKGEAIDKLLYGGYSTISLGYAGLYECVKYMTGKSHTDPSATPFALSDHAADERQACKEWKDSTRTSTSPSTARRWSPPPTSSPSACRSASASSRASPTRATSPTATTSTSPNRSTPSTKLEFEAQFQHLSPGGAISYVEVPDMQNNLDAVLEVMKFIYDNIIYAELNTKSDYCQVCGWDGEIEIVEEDGKLIWKCPQCGNTDQDKMNVARRTCGYIGTQFWNQGRTQEIKDRVLHL